MKEDIVYYKRFKLIIMVDKEKQTFEIRVRKKPLLFGRNKYKYKGYASWKSDRFYARFIGNKLIRMGVPHEAFLKAEQKIIELCGGGMKFHELLTASYDERTSNYILSYM
jgi:hypothetical protein